MSTKVPDIYILLSCIIYIRLLKSNMSHMHARAPSCLATDSLQNCSLGDNRENNDTLLMHAFALAALAVHTFSGGGERGCLIDRKLHSLT